MKNTYKAVVLALAAVISAQAATRIAPSQAPSRTEGELTYQERQRVAAAELTSPAPVYSGVAVDIARSPEPLQMVNPMAPASYGTGEQNVARDPVDNHVVGLKLLSIDF